MTRSAAERTITARACSQQPKRRSEAGDRQRKPGPGGRSCSPRDGPWPSKHALTPTRPADLPSSPHAGSPGGAFADHFPLKFRETREQIHRQPTHRVGGREVLRDGHERRAGGVQLLHHPHEPKCTQSTEFSSDAYARAPRGSAEGAVKLRNERDRRSPCRQR